jgi:hypothetical protein
MDYKMIYLAKRNPTVAPEDWPKTWRSHPKVVSQWPVVGAAIDHLNYYARIREPTLGGRPVDPPGVSKEYDGVAVVASDDPRLHVLDIPQDVYEKILEDERRVFSKNVEQFSLQCREAQVLGERRGPAAVIRFLARKSGTRESFQAAWGAQGTAAVERALAGGRVTRFVRNVVIADPPPGYAYDGIQETWFPDAETAVRSLSDPELAALDAELPAIVDLGRSVAMLTEVIYRLPRE